MAVTEQSFTDARRTLYLEWRRPPGRVGAVSLGIPTDSVPFPCVYSKLTLDEVDMYETGPPGAAGDLGPASAFNGVAAPYGVVTAVESRDVAMEFPATPQGESGQWAVHKFPAI